MQMTMVLRVSWNLPFNIKFYGRTFSSLYVNNNGNVTFDEPLDTYTPFGLHESAVPIIAPFFADVDTRGVGSNPVQYGYGETIFEGHQAFCVNWVNVGSYDQHADKLNSVQLLIVSRSDEGVGMFDVVFNYDRIQWETGDSSGGFEGLGGESARVGFAGGSGTPGDVTEFSGSGVPGAFLDSSSGGLVNQSWDSDVQGRYVFGVRGDGLLLNDYVALGDSYQSGEGAEWNRTYLIGTDNANNRCHRSNRAYPALLVSTDVVKLDLTFRACSGARISDMLSAQMAPYADGAAQIEALTASTRLVTVGIGGNDLDFREQ